MFDDLLIVSIYIFIIGLVGFIIGILGILFCESPKISNKIKAITYILGLTTGIGIFGLIICGITNIIKFIF